MRCSGEMRTITPLVNCASLHMAGRELRRQTEFEEPRRSSVCRRTPPMASPMARQRLGLEAAGETLHGPPRPVDHPRLWPVHGWRAGTAREHRRDGAGGRAPMTFCAELDAHTWRRLRLARMRRNGVTWAWRRPPSSGPEANTPPGRITAEGRHLGWRAQKRNVRQFLRKVVTSPTALSSIKPPSKS